MPIQYLFSEPDNVLCVKISVPVVLAEEEVQVIVDNVAALPELAQKIDHIDARLDDFSARPIFLHESGSRWSSVIEQEGWDRFGWHCNDHRQPVVRKVLVSGTLHKQIYYVDKEDHVKHVGEDIPFADHVDLDIPQPVVNEDDVYVQLHHKKIDMRWDLRRGSRLHQTGVMIFQVKVVEDRQIFVQVCPQLDRNCARGVNCLRDGSFDNWGSKNTPVFWGADNVVRYHNGALMGNCPNEDATLFQNIGGHGNRCIVPRAEYRLCFDAKELASHKDTMGCTTASFNLTVELQFFDGFGHSIGSESKTWNAGQITDNEFSNFCINATAPEEAREALVRFNFDANHLNSSAVVIDNVKLECVRKGNPHFEHFND